MRQSSYDYVFFGMGCASLSLVMRMIHSGKFSDKKILMIDKEPKTKNDRTWCFWETTNGFFDKIVYKRWPLISFLSDGLEMDLDITPYTYKMIRGIDFYNYCFEAIGRQPNIELAYGNIDRWYHEDSIVKLVLDEKTYDLGSPEVFNSVYQPVTTKNTIRLLQHFKGWRIQTKTRAFNPGKAIMMDFRVDQKEGTTFAYLLPFTETEALVEYTLFTKELLSAREYDEGLGNYIQNILGIIDYEIKEEEFGVIPMTNERLSFSGQGWQIGTAGGQTKASSGYTFQFIQKQSNEILAYLINGKDLHGIHKTPRRFRFYDHVLLHILFHETYPGKRIFTQLFRKNKPQQVLRFLDNESTLGEELSIIASLPTWPFLKAALQV